ncbi:hypothetical protein MIB92_14255 [Aestuariirhabdus sp. Z084]|uniref:hypothetical protein n=1 Tax=Aestuariirhabdus haliotis TaxID=2918751 RepID=UPI00201B3692|nr:hypothetical protein [Aestuariirhabdus haliotis]MCL6416819.1 hypothetical protein [Aestuariirhabdus haliotis]MCL6420819.1 hypothetical protein [Aestuariirhabdus haliotis]
MSIDFKRPAHVIVVHGVQTGEDENIHSDQQIRSLINRSLVDSHLEKEFLVKGYLYENINDQAQEFYQLIAKTITRGSPLTGTMLNKFIDVAGDVVTAAKNTSTAHKIRKGLREIILDSYRSKNQVVVVAHSLGTIYALDVINEIIRNSRYYKGDDRTTWPVQGLLTMGSPLGLGLTISGINIFDKRKINSIENAEFSLLPWHNYYNRLDPIVSGSLFGTPTEIDSSKGPVEQRYGPSVLASNWLLQGHVVTSGEQWLFAHVSYWNNPAIGDKLVDMIWG